MFERISKHLDIRQLKSYFQLYPRSLEMWSFVFDLLLVTHLSKFYLSFLCFFPDQVSVERFHGGIMLLPNKAGNVSDKKETYIKSRRRESFPFWMVLKHSSHDVM